VYARATAGRQALGIQQRRQRTPLEALRIISANAAFLAAKDVANYLPFPALNNKLVRAGLYALRIKYAPKPSSRHPPAIELPLHS
jgi:hypothetical protein